ncbi:unnamed protein product [Sphagnum troendelagicum]
MVQSIVSGLEDRFPEGDLLDSSAIFDVASYRGKSTKEIADVESFDYAAAKEFHSRPVGELLRKELDFLAKEAEKPVEQLSNVSQLLRNLHAK